MLCCLPLYKFKHLITKLLHIGLSLLVLLSTSGWVLSKHYCGGVLKNVALFGEATPCHDNKLMKSCPLHGSMPASNGQSSDDNDCCDTTNELIKLDNEEAKLSAEFNLSNHPVLIVVLMILGDLVLDSCDDKTTHYLSYKPPLLVCDLPVRLQTFLC